MLTMPPLYKIQKYQPYSKSEIINEIESLRRENQQLRDKKPRTKGTA